MIFERFKNTEQKIDQSTIRFEEFHHDWLRKNNGMKRVLESIQNTVMNVALASDVLREEMRIALNNFWSSEVVRQIVTRVEQNDQQLVAALFGMFNKIRDEVDLGTVQLVNVSTNLDAINVLLDHVLKAVRFDWGLLNNIEDLRLDFNKMMTSFNMISENILVNWYIKDIFKIFQQFVDYIMICFISQRNNTGDNFMAHGGAHGGFGSGLNTTPVSKDDMPTYIDETIDIFEQLNIWIHFSLFF